MEKQINTVIEELKAQLKSNLKTINANQDIINEILSLPSQTERERREDEFSWLFEENKKLLSVNDDLIQLQIDLVKFKKKYYPDTMAEAKKNNSVRKDELKRELTKEEIFDLTVKEVVPFNSSHPYFNDELFFNELLKFYVNKESYETCDDLVKTRV